MVREKRYAMMHQRLLLNNNFESSSVSHLLVVFEQRFFPRDLVVLKILDEYRR
jgi:hypothetical protein